MPCTFTCLHCGHLAPYNPRLKNEQQYCSAHECQKARMRSWKHKQYKNNQVYRKKCNEHQANWRKSYPSDQYQRSYREKHPLYVKRNRELQRKRNKKRKKECAGMIVRTDAIVLQPRDDGCYVLSKVKKNMIVNRNALSTRPSIDGIYALFKTNGKNIVNRNALLPASLGP